MTQTHEATWFSDSDKHEILGLLPQINNQLKPAQQQKLQQIENREGRESDEYLQEVMRLYKEHMLGVFEKSDGPRRERGAGRRKIGGHGEGKHR
jgi:hypothetical protein